MMDDDTFMEDWDDPANPFNPENWSNDNSIASRLITDTPVDGLQLAAETRATQDTPAPQGLTELDAADEITRPSAETNYASEEEPSSAVAKQDAFVGEYHLRESTRHANRAFASTWVDHDETGDYNPAEEARKARQWKRRLRPTRRDDEANGHVQTPNDADGVTGDDADSATGMRPVVLIKFASEAGKAAFSELCLRRVSKVEPLDDFSTGYRLRARKGPGEPTAVNHLNYGEEAIAGLPQELTGHPVARGCWDCYRLGLHCSLLDHEFCYSCEACKEDGNDCHLITEPVRKMCCTYCLHLQQKDKSIVCSFDYEDDHSGPCKRCVRDGNSPCIAGPRPDAIVARRRIGNDDRPFLNEQDWDYAPSHESSCRQCQNAERACSFVDGNLGDLCTACEMFGLDCSPILSLRHRDGLSAKPAPSKKAKTRTRKAVRKAQRESATDTTRETSADSDPAMGLTEMTVTVDPKPIPRPAVRTVKTNFAHPMGFNVEKGCHFCRDPKLCFLGLGERTVDVVELDNGCGWQEVSGGHRAEGLEQTRVCSNCTTARVAIACCGGHDMRTILGLGADTPDGDAALDVLMSGTPGKERWCSVCCNLAVYECCTAKGHAMPGDDAVDVCRLALCTNCHLQLGRSSGKLDDLLDGLEDEEDEKSDEAVLPRADRGLLKENGLLVQFALCSP